MSDGAGWLLRDVEIDGRRTDCRLSVGAVAEIGTDLPPLPGEAVLDGRGGALVPGLADHHLHILATAAAAASLDLAGGEIATAPETPGSGWLRVIGSGEPDLDRHTLDRRWPDRPVRLQHRGGALWTLNSAAVELLGDGLRADERRTGRVWRSDARLRRLVGSTVEPAALGTLGARLAGYGLTHLTDAGPDLDAGALVRLRAALPQHVHSMGPAGGSMPRKIVVTDHEPPRLGDLTSRIADAHEQGRPAAVHAVSAVALALALAAFEQAGTRRGDRIEHAAVCDDDAARVLAELGLTVVTQPSLAVRHGLAYLRDTEPGERSALWRHAGLRRVGVTVVVSSDAPYGDANPWHGVQAAATRRLPDGTTLGTAETIPAAAAFATLLSDPADPGGPLRRISPEAPADLTLLDGPLHVVIAAAMAGVTPVRATFVRGRRIH
ncbi:amidohydrolase family protein [Actinophytocola sp.]|uniref:amidohydrolase family protein n=1 Tax=Actinophytocola sp. TaxID=1872138 RepID=UPI003D6C6DD6